MVHGSVVVGSWFAGWGFDGSLVCDSLVRGSLVGVLCDYVVRDQKPFMFGACCDYFNSQLFIVKILSVIV